MKAHLQSNGDLVLFKKSETHTLHPNHPKYAALMRRYERARQAQYGVPDGPDSLALSVDARGRKHKGKGPGGGQYARKDEADSGTPTERRRRFGIPAKVCRRGRRNLFLEQFTVADPADHDTSLAVPR